MNKGFCSSRELLSTLVEMDAKLSTVISDYSKSNTVVQSENLDEFLEDFLENQDDESLENRSLPSELAVFYLHKEVKKTIDVVIESNSLRAFYDFKKHSSSFTKSDISEFRKLRLREVFIGAIIGVVISTIVFWYLFPPGL